MISNITKYKPYDPNMPVRVAFLYQDPTLWPAWESLYHFLCKDDRFIVSVFRTEKAEFTYERQNAFLEEKDITFIEFSEDAVDNFDPHVVFLQTPYDYLGRPVSAYSLRFKNKGVRVVYVPYGIEIVDTPSSRYDHFRTPAIRNAYRIYVLSQAFAEEYRKYCGNYEAVRAFGLPRFDMLYNKKQFELPASLMERINGRPVIVWHAHFSKFSFINGAQRTITPYLEEYIEFAEYLKQYEKFFFIFLPHPKFGNDLSDPISNEKSLVVLKTISETENAYIDYADDYRPSLMNADAVITDRSSLMIEAAICGGPVLLLHNPDYIEQIFKPLEPLTDEFYHGTGCDEMVKFLNMIEKGEDPRKPAREEAFRLCIPCMDGKCAERIIEDIYSSLTTETIEKSEREFRNQKLILFGAGFMYQKITENYEFPENYEITAVSDNDSAKWGKEFGGAKCVPPSEIRNIEFDKVIIMASNLFEEQIYQQLRFELEIPESKIEYCEYLAKIGK